MGDSTSTQAERAEQLKFRIAERSALLLLAVSIGLFDFGLGLLSNRTELGRRNAELRFDPVRLDTNAFRPFRLAGAWRVSSHDPRVGGISAMAVDQDRLLALTDSGVLVRFSPPSGPTDEAEVRELPGGPGSGRFKRNRDSEALARDPIGRGWWVAFENRHGLWLYDPRFRRAIDRVGLGHFGWRVNTGVEGIGADGKQLLLIPEPGDRILRYTGSGLSGVPIGNSRGRISDVATIGPNLWIAVERRPTLLGFANSLVLLHKAEAGFRFGKRIRLPLGPIDNVEAIAADRRSDGRLRLWLMTDDNFQPPFRTLLLALDLPAPQGAQAE